MSDFTSGPWRVNAIRGDESVDVTTDSGVPLQIANCHQGAIANAKANALLIAAAPDMLEALKDAMRSSRKDFKLGPDGDRQHREAYAEQFAAIAMAEGRDHA